MIHPKQSFTALDFGRSCASPDFERHLSEYLLIRREILGEPGLAARYALIINALDSGFRHQNEDSIVLTVARKSAFVVNLDLEALSRAAPAGRPLKLIYIDARGEVIQRASPVVQ